MIVDNPVTFELTLAQDKRIPQTNDARLEVPPLIMPAVLSLLPHHVMTSAAIAEDESFFATRTVQIAPSSAAAANPICILGPGLWELEINFAVNGDFASVAATPSLTAIQMNFQGGATTHFLSQYITNGVLVQFGRWRILIRSQMELRILTPATAAGQNIAAQANVNGIRIL